MTLMAIVAMSVAQAQQTLVVAHDGTGDFATIQEAVDAVAEGAEATIRIKAGTYEGMVKVGTRQRQSAKRISMIGEGMENTIITAGNGKNNIGSGKDVRDYATLAVFADDFYAQDLCVRNTGGASAGQALALFVSGDRQTYYRCRVAGYQDTHRTKKDTRSYFKECVIEGATDYIYAGGTCWFERCSLHCVGKGYITAPEDINVYVTADDGTRIWLGFIFSNCTVTKSDDVAANSVALGRCWGEEKCGSLFLNCQLNNVVKAAGWDVMGGNDGTKSYYAEYKSMNGSALADVSQRIGWSHQLTEADYEKLNSWAKVDAAYRTVRTEAPAYDPEAVIAARQQAAQPISADDYAPLEQRLLAFPTARGFGKYVSGGRGGKVVEVTNLDDSGEGSLRWALTEAGKENATIVFRVSGVIDIGPNPQRTTERSIRASLKNVTIAGQTAPGEGILLRGGKLNLGGSSNVIIRNIRSRLGVMELERNEGETDDAYRKRCFIEGGSIGIENASNIIIDHCCFGWSGEENMTMYDNHFTTVQWSIVHDGLYNAGHSKGARGYGCQWGGSPATFHHNLLANNDSRSGRVNGASNASGDRNVFLEYTNNVNFNWGRQNSCYGGENEAGTYSSHECNFAGNYYKPGPARPAKNTSYFIELSAARSGKTLNGPSVWYIADNVMEGRDAATNDNWSAVGNKTGYDVSLLKSATVVYPSAEYTRMAAASFDSYDDYRTPVETAAEAYEHVLAKVGTIRRDAVERRVIEDVVSGQPKYKGPSANKQGIIDTPADADGWPVYDTAEPVADGDHDGMADDWELANGFDPTNGDDRNVIASAEGYTALEVYLCALMGEQIPIVHTGISQVMSPVSVVGRQFYTADGQQRPQLRRGLNIVREQLDNGTQRTVKVMKR